MRIVLALAVALVSAAASAQESAPGPADFARAMEARLLRKADGIAARLPEPDGQCARGVVNARVGPPARAFAQLISCDRVSAELEPWVRRARRDLDKKLARGRFAPVSVVLEPKAAVVDISSSSFSGLRLVGPELLWLHYGKHTLTASADGFQQASTVVVVDDRSRQTVVLQLAEKRAASAVTSGSVDFSDEAAAEPQATGNLKKIKRKSLLPDRYAKRRAIAPSLQQLVLSPWDLRLAAALGPSSWADGDDSVLGYRVAGSVARRFGSFGVEAGLGISSSGGKLAGDSARSTYVGFELLGRARVSGGGWGGSIGVGPLVRLPFADQVVGRELASAVVGVAGEVTVARQLGATTWLELTGRTDLGTEAVDGLGRTGLVSAGLALVWTLPSKAELAPLPTDGR
ncbi:MAG: hypothetical protein KJO07_02635 [Deltaproteobacteria bacterium]|nr:hypothetical protein [Deltaproteobacteria bacterium]